MSRQFDGTNSVRTPPSSGYSTLSQETIAFWVLPTNLTNQSVAFLKNFNPIGASNHGPLMLLSGGNIQVSLSDGGAGSVSSTTIPTGLWSHITATIDYSLAPA